MTETISVWTPRVALVTAERHVEYERILAHILSRRAVVERMAVPVARRIAWQIVNAPYEPVAAVDELARRLDRSLGATLNFGYQEARRELASLRRAERAQVTAAYQFPDAGQHSRLARGGRHSIRHLIRYRADETARATLRIARAAVVQGDRFLPAPVKVAAAAAAATRVLHNHVLELVGETLNLGRAAGVQELARPPEYAMRSEQLDTNTCDPCDELHGTIVEIGSDDYYDLMPPAECLGGGRCRGIYVYGDTPAQMEQAA